MSCDVKGCTKVVLGVNSLGWELCEEHLYTAGMGTDQLTVAALKRMGLVAEKALVSPENKAIAPKENK